MDSVIKPGMKEGHIVLPKVCAGTTPGPSRYVLLDTIRGFTLVSMILYHTVWDLVYLFGVPLSWYQGMGGYLWQQSICYTFILLSGFCWPLGRHPLKRGLITSAGGLAVTAATLLFMPENRVIFGILTLLGVCMLLMIPADRLLRKVPPALGLCGSLLLFLLTRGVNEGALTIGGRTLTVLPDELYRGLFATFLGFTDGAFYSSDYFSLFPWLFLYCAGYFTCLLWKKYDRESRLPNCRIAGFSALGRHSLMVYLLHQPAVWLVLSLLFQLGK